MGILILLSVSDRDVRIETGYKMQSYFTDLVSGKILDQYGMDSFRENKFAEGLIAVQSATISEIEKNVPVDWETQTISDEKIDINLWPIFMWIFGFLILCGLGFGIVKIIDKIKVAKNKKLNDALSKRDGEWTKKLNKAEKDYHLKETNLQRVINEKNNDISELEHHSSSLENELSKYEEKFRRIRILHPNIESEIKKQIEDEHKQNALKWDESVRNKVNLVSNENNINSFKEVIDSYNNLPFEERTFVKTDIDSVKQKYNKSIELKDIAIAGAVGTIVLACCNKFKNGDHSNYSEISEVYNKYKNLSKNQKNVFPNKDIVTNLNNLYRAASLDNDHYTIAKKAEEQIKEILDIVGSYGYRDDVSRLKNAKNIYEELSSSQTKYVDNSLYEEILKKLRQAEDDEEDYRRKKRREEEERQRRINSSSSSFSSGSFGGFSGHGGHSSGGGASRHF